MNDTLREQVSAYIDGELPDGESELLVRRLSQDPALRDLVEKYMTMGRVLRGEAIGTGMDSLRSRIAAELGSEPEPAVPVEAATPEPAGRFLRPVAGVARAATVAVVALVGLQQIGPVESPVATMASNDLAAVAIDDVPLYTEPPVSDVIPDRPSATLTRYYQHHNERAADLGGSGIFTRLVELELRGGEIAPPLETLDSVEVSGDSEAGAPGNDSPENSVE